MSDTDNFVPFQPKLYKQSICRDDPYCERIFWLSLDETEHFQSPHPVCWFKEDARIYK